MTHENTCIILYPEYIEQKKKPEHCIDESTQANGNKGPTEETVNLGHCETERGHAIR